MAVLYKTTMASAFAVPQALRAAPLRAPRCALRRAALHACCRAGRSFLFVLPLRGETHKPRATRKSAPPKLTHAARKPVGTLPRQSAPQATGGVRIHRRLRRRAVQCCVFASATRIPSRWDLPRIQPLRRVGVPRLPCVSVCLHHVHPAASRVIVSVHKTSKPAGDAGH